MNFSRKLLSTIGAAAMFGAIGLPAWASAGDEMAEGQVRKIDVEQGKVTLKHGEIKSLDMPPMTMVFVVKDKAMLNNLKTGDKVRFKVVNENGKFTLVELVSAN